MVRVSDFDEYLHGENVKDGDVVQIEGKPRFVDSEESALGKAYLEMIVKLPGGNTKLYTPNKTTLRACAPVFGDDTDAWVGKKIVLHPQKQIVRGQQKIVIYGEPLIEKPVTQGRLEPAHQ
jgi:hypothetical protein